ncbi:MAG TPA: VWA domain-containing protein [Thermoanaerobaculia bacterium]
MNMRLGHITLSLLAAPLIAAPTLAAASSPGLPHDLAPPHRVEEAALAPTGEAVAADSTTGRLEVRFPGERLSRTLVQWVYALASNLVQRNEHGFYNVRLSGEVSHDQQPVDRFDYRFDIPAPDDADEPLALVFDRDLRPGRYEVSLEVEDLSTGKSFRTRDLLEVPDLPEEEPPAEPPAEEPLAVPALFEGDEPFPITRPPVLAAAPAPPFAIAEPPAAAAPAAAAPAPEAPAIELLRPRTPIVVGHHRFAAVARGPGIERVTFLLDDVPVMAKTRPPFAVELDLGDEPVVRRLAAVAWGSDPDTPLARDEMVLNTGQERFAVELVSPTAGGAGGELTGRCRVATPAGQRLARVEWYVGDERVAVVDRPPFDRGVPLGHARGPAAVRAVAHLADGRTSEDTVLVGTAGVSEKVDVHLVELYTAVVDGRGRALDGLSAADFRVIEDGTPQEIARLERVTDLPLHVSLVLDVSGSMGGVLGEIGRAAAGFLDGALGPADRASVVTFDKFPRVVVDFTDDRALLANGMTALRARGGTALHEGLLFALRQFDGIQGQRVVLLFSDGKEGSDRLASEAVLEYARQSGVTVYTIGLGIPFRESAARGLLARLARDTGGRSHFVERADEVTRVAAEIERDMRSRYLLAYQSSNPAGGGFRVVDVEVARSGAEARTVRGYYP